jgi:hypothetical protein
MKHAAFGGNRIVVSLSGRCDARPWLTAVGDDWRRLLAEHFGIA